jgi:1-aminocyclopropane-1-carboxylate deaminase
MDELMKQVLNNETNELLFPSPSDPKRSWLEIDWEGQYASIPLTEPSRVDTALVRDRVVYIKRDDQLRLRGSHISGNKARKMLALNALAPTEFPDCVVSYGGPQSNAMVALAAVVRYMNDQLATENEEATRKRLVYYTKKLPRFLRNQPSGNLFRAQTLGMELVELSSSEYGQLFGGDSGGQQEAPPTLNAPVPGSSLWVPQGAFSSMAIAGAKHLAQEIYSFWSEKGGSTTSLLVFVPGGTCSTALLLHRAIKELTRNRNNPQNLCIEVVVIPCVGDEGYARRQMMSLNTALGVESTDDLPIILPPAPTHPSYVRKTSSAASDKYFQFGEPDARILETLRRMDDEHEIPLDLLYNAPSWTIMFRHWRTTFETDPRFANKAILYVHSGGLDGINSQLLRYKYKGLVDIDDVQLPGRNR